METYKQWDIIAVPFPFTDTNQTKKRPALVLNKNIFQTNESHLILSMITSATNSHWNSDIPIINLETTGLTHASIIRFKLFTLDERLIIRKIGTLSSEDINNVKQQLKNILDL